MKAIGKYNWAISAGRIPFLSTGKEPEFTSHDKISVLNTSGEEATISITILYEDEPPVEGYEVKIKPRRVRKIRFNDLINPTAMRLERNFGCLIKSDVPVVVQFSRADTGARANAQLNTLAYAADTGTATEI